MKKIIYIIGLFISVNVFAQTNTEKYLPNGEPKFYYDGQENKTTDPNAASNRKFELRPNYFNWTQQYFRMNARYMPLLPSYDFYAESPFFLSSCGNFDNKELNRPNRYQRDSMY